MPPPETMFCSQQINIPTGLPEVLKNFTKAAIRTQPKDLLVWSAAYFDALAKGEILPVKERLEINFGSQTKDAMLTPGLLKTLHKQLSFAETCGREMLQDKWKALCLPMEQLENMLILGNFSMDVSWMEFFALGCSALGDSLKTSLKVACEILTEDEEGGAARIPFEIFSLLCTYLANLDPEMPQGHIDGFLTSLEPQVLGTSLDVQVCAHSNIARTPNPVGHPTNSSERPDSALATECMRKVTG
ncbi:ropporin-1-like protein isoform X1 [Hippocampus comes]|uniref:ropporin-1-like protein isoform X1 n=1 Tax=Hippocampus comes TaxID=109280 RepID=UPI00094ED2B5|nr:PREDICTED: ropporin-1-like protein isoform X1 [Hippocampus comes]XP_019725004.1 PREDICTED: ropporin-1-like protein isoform X1 [Hippocampus comes]XP_019725005.1 PREDICTED: ropporin-1-like protein isoform X1 [Hippocampus comes]XP_019725006.1 PREDICTED: ropporin-1-like protein isoform X1 [Hippocampus comes]XP_019725007.1 PREDICTED: ropporin-1-like protein isoform X1 [Hippocampus comes]XP_019725008.1 PREDICTED: ropporin-1-like protein isoform X1 [Hippocampus comes]XP_019725010.1 PREDICTED: rop